jgi:hypothetical protein
VSNRAQLYEKLGMGKPIVTPILDVIYRVEEEQAWKQDLNNSPHGQHWSYSFHASAYPGDNDKACPRAALYTLMNIPGPEPVNRAGRAVMEVGAAIEDHIVWRLYRSGILLSPPPSEEHQMGFTDTDHWLTGSPDAVIRTPKNKPYVIETKTKDREIVEQMQQGQRSYDPHHKLQLMVYLDFVVKNSKKLWPDLEQATHGSIVYLARDRPHITHEYKFRHDPDLIETGHARLAEWKQLYLNEELPERPKDWFWSKPEYPCKWCPFKKPCKADVKEGVTKLTDSNAIAWADRIYDEGYDYDEQRKNVIDFWKEKGDASLG